MLRSDFLPIYKNTNLKKYILALLTTPNAYIIPANSAPLALHPPPPTPIIRPIIETTAFKILSN